MTVLYNRISIKTSSGRIIIAAIAIILLIFIGLLIYTVTNINTQPETYEESISYEIDPASGERIMIGNYTGTPGDSALYVGTKILTSSGMSMDQFSFFMETLDKYCEENNITLERVSYKKNSLWIKKQYYYEFQIVLNIDQVLLNIVVDTTSYPKSPYGMTVTILDDKSNVLYSQYSGDLPEDPCD